MRIVLLGDIHLYRLSVPPWRLLSNRLVGQLNLWLRRRHHFDRSLLPGVIGQVLAIKPDMLLLSGDLTTTAIESEFADVRAALRPATSQIDTFAVPGNHDRYTFTSAWTRRFEKHIEPFAPGSFPHLRKLTDRWYLLALDPALPRLFSSRGRVGKRQLHEAQRLLDSLEGDVGLLLVCHYPCWTPPGVRWKWDHRLADAGALLRLVCSAARKHPHVLFVHGHIHEPWCRRVGDHGRDNANLTMLNAGAPCLHQAKYPAGQGFWQIELPDDPRCEVRMIHHVPRQNAGCIVWQSEPA